ncbi:MAG: ABC transporter permease [Planctomycetota bacterium]
MSTGSSIHTPSPLTEPQPEADPTTRVVRAAANRSALGLSGYVAHVRWLIEHLPLVLSLARTQLKLTVSRSRLYYLWWMLDPVLDTACYAVLFALLRAGTAAGLDTVPTVAFLLAGIVPWRMNAACWSASGQMWQAHRAILEQVRFPHLVLPIARFLSECWLYAVALGVLLAACVLFGVTPSWTWLLLPLWVCVHGLMVLAFMPLFAIGSAFSLDLLKLQPYLLRLIFFFSPVLYGMIPMVPPWLRPWFLLNPMTMLMETYRGILFHGYERVPAVLDEAGNTITPAVVWTLPSVGAVGLYIGALMFILFFTSYAFIRLQPTMSRNVSRMY